jgi:heptosyltransferase-1
MTKKISIDDLRTLTADRICVIKPSAFGDVIQTLPLLPALRARFPQAEISWVINRELEGLLQGHPDLNNIITFERKGSLRDWRRLARKLRRGKFDLVFDLQGLLRTGFMTMATSAPVRVGLETTREGSHLACNIILPDTGKNIPAHTRYWRVAEALGVGDLPRRTIIHTAPEDHSWSDAALESLSGPILALHPGARWATKLWPVENFAVVASRAARQFGFNLVIVGGPAEKSRCEELELTIRRIHPLSTVRNLAGASQLKQLTALLGKIDLLLTNDSGPMHLAAGIGKPVLGVFTCTSPERSGPPGDQHALIAADVPCAASYYKRCPKHGPEFQCCMDQLSAEKVWREFVELLRRSPQIQIPERPVSPQLLPIAA